MKHEVLALVRPVSWKNRYLLNPELYADAVTQMAVNRVKTGVKGKGAVNLQSSLCLRKG